MDKELFPGLVVLHQTGVDFRAYSTGGSKDASLWRNATLGGERSWGYLFEAKEAAGREGLTLEKISETIWAARQPA